MKNTTHYLYLDYRVLGGICRYRLSNWTYNATKLGPAYLGDYSVVRYASGRKDHLRTTCIFGLFTVKNIISKRKRKKICQL